MKKVIVYGLGENFRKHSEWISKNYEIIGYCDQRNELSVFFSPFFTCLELSEIDADILICPSSPTVWYQLVLSYGVPPPKMFALLDEVYLRRTQAENIENCFYSFAQFGEDYVIANTLNDMKVPLCEANYIEIGVNNPLVDSNTLFLHYAGASGILVDANPYAIPMIMGCRKKQKIFHNAVVPSGGERAERITLHITDELGLASTEIQSIEFNSGTISENIEVDTISINKILEYMPKCTVLSIDIEGLDEQVLRDVNYSKFHPQIIISETRNASSDLISFMNLNGYRRVFCNGINDIWNCTK